MKYENWDPFDDLLALREKMNALFERSLERARSQFSAPETVPVNVNLWDTKDAYIIFAELPGVSINDIEVSVVGEHLTVKGNKKRVIDDKSASFFRIERNTGNFSRRFVLPDPVDSKKIEATLTCGVLKIIVPKENATSKVIPVKTE